MSEQAIEHPSIPASVTKPPKKSVGPKSDTLRKLLVRRNGATVAQVQKQLGWQPHTVRAAISRLRSTGVSIELDRSGKVARYWLLPGDGQ